RAKPTRRRMPPESSDGILSPVPSRRTMDRHSSTRSPISWRDSLVSRCSGNATFCQTVIESNRAPSWNEKPNLRRNSVICRLLSVSTAVPSTMTLPESGLSRPMMCFRSTLLPVPEPPMTTSASLRPISMSTPSSTTLEPNDLCRSWMQILQSEPVSVAFAEGVSVIGLGSEENPGEEEVRDQDGDARDHHGRGRGLADALGAAGGVEPLLAPDRREQNAEDGRLDDARQEVVQVHELEGAVDVGDRVRPHHDDRHQVAAEDPHPVAEDDQKRQHDRARPHPRHDQIVD